MSRGGRTTRDRRGPAASAAPGTTGSPTVPRTPTAGGSTASRRVASRDAGSRTGGDRRRRLLGPVVAVCLVAGLAVLLWAGPLLAVRDVRVDGVRVLPADQVREVAAVQEGTPLLRVDVDAAAARVADLPQVADVQVSRGWPSTVVITVQERTALAVVERSGSRMLVDAAGVLFDEVTGAPPGGVVRLEVDRPGPDDAATAAALDAIAALPADVRTRVAIASAGPEGPGKASVAVVLHLADGTEVRWGDATQARRKAAVLGALLAQVEAGELEGADVVDVSAPGAVVLR